MLVKSLLIRYLFHRHNSLNDYSYLTPYSPVSPLAMCTNCLMIAKTYSRMRNKEKAIEYLQKTIQFELKTPDDFQVYENLPIETLDFLFLDFTAQLS